MTDAFDHIAIVGRAMSSRFTGPVKQFKQRLAELDAEGIWQELNENQLHYRHRDGGVLNWYPSTGTLHFQGPKPQCDSLAIRVAALLQDEPGSEIDMPRDPVPAPRPRSVPEMPTPQESSIDTDFLGHRFSNSEIVIGLVGAAGSQLADVAHVLDQRLSAYGYSAEQIRVSNDIIPNLVTCPAKHADEYTRISSLMDAGNEARRVSGDNSVLALGIAAKISSDRPVEDGDRRYRRRQAYIVNSVKHPDEVARLRQIYPEGFYLIGVYADEGRRHKYLVEEKRCSPDQADALMRRDEDEHLPYGQRTSDSFHLSDFFVRIDENQDKLRKSLWRIMDILFGHPYITPTFDEYAMFMAFSAALRSADLSRQVGAVIAKDHEILAAGANDCPRFGGGLYWSEYDEQSFEIRDAAGGRDHTRGEDANKVEQQRIIDDIVARLGSEVPEAAVRDALATSMIGDITEYGRTVHAEMEALLACGRSNQSPRGATVYATTFPCHNCAKHIVAAGIRRVVYVEPYPKSKAAELHSDSITLGFTDSSETVHFEPFVGVGPRRFFDLFSMRLSSGFPLARKNSAGKTVEWRPEEAKLRIQMLPCSYLELELLATSLFNECVAANGGAGQ